MGAGSRVGQREKLKYNAVKAKVSAIPTGRSRTEMALQSHPEFRQENCLTHNPALTSHRMKSVPEKEHDVGEILQNAVLFSGGQVPKSPSR